MTAPTITHVQAANNGFGFHLLWSDGRALYCSHPHEFLRACGLRLTIPDDVQPGWVGIPEPIPTPPAISERWANIYPATDWWPDRATADQKAACDRIAVVRVWTDADGDHAEVIRCD